MAGVSRSKTIQQRLAEASAPADNGCIEWQRSCDQSGYGLIRYVGRDQKAHRVSYMVNIGHIPQGLVVCHKCDNTRCINPAHLFVGSRADNNDDKMLKGRCLSGSKTKNAKINELDAEKIWLMSATYKSIAEEFGVSASVISSIKNKRTWKAVTKNLPPPENKGRHKGTLHPHVRFTEADIKSIRNDTRPMKLIAADFDCSIGAVNHIKQRNTWRHIP